MQKFLLIIFTIIYSIAFSQTGQERGRAADFGIKVGDLEKGSLNMITDVEGVMVGHYTLNSGDQIRTGVTAILPHGGNIFQNKVQGSFQWRRNRLPRISASKVLRCR